ncbi:MAG: LAGLIDADG family homing endonuclease [Candidatus Taylorbacteria bacterium]
MGEEKKGKLALYRKYRPQSFRDVLGQDHIVKVLKGSIEAGKISHAYLFEGSRGTGKTSIARIFAREIGTSDNDLYEIDAASNRGIDDVRELREGVSTLPFDSKHKVYIVDECLTSDHLIQLADGAVKSIAEIKNGDEVASVDLNSGTIVFKKISNWFSRKTKELISIRTPQSTLKCTPTHKLWVMRKGAFSLVKAEDINFSDFLISPASLPHKAKNLLTKDQAAFLALIQCDGHISKDSCTIQVEISKDVQYFISSFTNGCKAWNCGGEVTITKTKRGTTLLRSYSPQLKKELIKLLCPSGKKSNSIDIPDAIFQAPLESIRAYIDTCFCCEGDATFTKSTRLFKLSFNSCSPIFSKKLQLLLKKFGIGSGAMEIKRKNIKHQTVYRLNITGYDLRIFQNSIGLSIQRKADVLKNQFDHAEKQDSIPLQVPFLARRKELRLSHMILNQHGIYLDQFQGLMRETVKEFIKVAEAPEFNPYLQFRYEKILTIERLEENARVYDFTVEDTHTFIANGICSSNCHMLTKEANNALLKTLEEPPEHVVFILATTEMEKLPETIISRCQVFNFKKPSLEVLRDVVSVISKKEGYSLEAPSLELIALLGEGSFRDTQGILQKVLSFSKDKKITHDEVEMVTGAPRAELVNECIEAIEEQNIERGLSAVRNAAEANIDMKTYVKLVLFKVRLILLLKYAKEMEEEIKEETGQNDFNFLKKMSANPTLKISSKTVIVLLNALDKVGFSYLPQLPLELALIKLCGKEE